MISMTVDYQAPEKGQMHKPRISKTRQCCQYLCNNLDIWSVEFYNLLAEGPGVARGKKILKKKKFRKIKFWIFFSLCHPWVSTKNFSPIGPVVWPAIGNIYTNVLFNYIDLLWSNKLKSVKHTELIRNKIWSFKRTKVNAIASFFKFKKKFDENVAQNFLETLLLIIWILMQQTLSLEVRNNLNFTNATHCKLTRKRRSNSIDITFPTLWLRCFSSFDFTHNCKKSKFIRLHITNLKHFCSFH